jgi:type I restriction enzyme S subunit
MLIGSPYVREYLGGSAVGATMQNLNQSILLRLVVGLPPLAEQHRIVAKVDELMALCDRLEAARAERETTRDRLAAASLGRLNAPDPDPATFADHARFALNNLAALTARAEQVKQIRQTILNFAVRGKLVPQDSNDEPASELLKRIAPLPRPARYAKRSPELIPGDCGLSINNPKTSLPKGWLWVPLVEIARLESGHTPSRNRPDWWDGGIPWIGLVDARAHNNGTIFDTIQHTNEQGLANSAARVLPEGTVCFSRTASVGYVVIMGRPMATSQDFVNWVPTDVLSSSWLQLVMIAERPALGRFSKGAVHQTIYYPAWLSMHIALPPLAEQHRIVAKVDALMAVCDQLEASLTTAADTRRRLLDALLAEALVPSEARELEAAE